VHELGYSNESSSKNKGMVQVPNFLIISSAWFPLEFFCVNLLPYLFIC